MAHWVGRAPQGHEVFSHDPEVRGSNIYHALLLIYDRYPTCFSQICNLFYVIFCFGVLGVVIYSVQYLNVLAETQHASTLIRI